MTRSEFRLTEISIEAFRGFRDPAVFDLDASAVIFTGPNGTGKTSVFDALQWVLVGSIERLEGLRARKTVEHVVSGYRLGDRARVSIEVRVGDQLVSIARSGDYRESTLEVIGVGARPFYGDAAEEWLGSVLVPREPGALDLALSTCGLLQQDVMRSVLEAKPADRYAHISTVLGLSRLEDFEREAQEASKAAAERRKQALALLHGAQGEAESMAARLEMLGQRALQRASVEVARTELEDGLVEAEEFLEAELPALLDDGAASQLASRARRMLSAVQRHVDARSALAREIAMAGSAPESNDVAVARAAWLASQEAVKDAETERTRLTSELSAAEAQAQQAARLAAAALPMLASRCPVCDQQIDQETVERRLRELSQDSDHLVQLRDALQGVDLVLTRAREQAVEFDRERRRLEELESSWTRFRQRQAELDDSARALRAQLQDGGGIRIRNGDFVERAPDLVRALDRIASILERYSDAAKDSRSTGELDRARAELEGARATLEEVRRRGEQAAARATRMKQLADATAKARVDVTTARFQAIEPLVEDIYGRLDPHPAFKGIGFQHDMYYGKGTSTPYVSDVVAGVDADPLIVFSASQANIAALSFFLAMSLGAGERALPFILLDDPLQSMDDVNVLGFADLCRFLRSERQLILSTHDRRFANLLQRKLVPRLEGDRTVLYRFTAWDRRGPSVEMEAFDHQPGDSALRILSATA